MSRLFMEDSYFYVLFSDTRWHPQATSVFAKETGQKGGYIKPSAMRVRGEREGGFLEVTINGFGFGVYGLKHVCMNHNEGLNTEDCNETNSLYGDPAVRS